MRFFPVFLLGLTTVVAHAQTPEIPEIPLTEAEIQIDGRLDEAAWSRAARFDLRYETRPGENTPAPVATEAYITYSRDYLYVGFRAHDPEPEKIRAHYTDRDNAYDDDFIGIVIDPFNDERRAFEYFANPLGVQMDLFLDDVSGTEDDSYNAIWDSRGTITADGYELEMAIPMQSLRFPDVEGAQVWSIDLIRFWPRDHRYRLSVHPMDRGRNCYLCQNIKIRGFAEATPGNALLVTPTLTSRVTERRDDPSAPFESRDEATDAGVTVEWGITPNVIASGTVNPDFSQVEADVAQLDINNQFALFYPERRPFFLEGADFFDTPLDIVYTRNIADPDWGAKLTGKEGGHAFGVFTTDDQVTNLIYPGSQRNAYASFDFESRAQVVRYRRDVGEGSALGVLATDRRGAGYVNTVAGGDGLIRFSGSDSLRLQALQSTTEYNARMQQEFGAPAGRLEDRAWLANYSHEQRNYFAYAEMQDVGESFRADLGFLPQVGYEKAEAGGGYIRFGDGGDWYQRLQLNGNWDVTHEQGGQLLEREFETYASYQGPLQSYLEAGWIDREVYYSGARFDQQIRQYYAEFIPTGAVSLGGFLRRGDAIDFANVQAARQLRIEPWLKLKLGRHLRMELSQTHEHLDVPGGRLFTADLSELRMAWQFNLRMYVRLIAQYQDVERNVALYSEPAETRSRSLANQLLFSYKANPQTVIYAGYSDGYVGDAQFDLQQNQRTVFVKLSYAWQT